MDAITTAIAGAARRGPPQDVDELLEEMFRRARAQRPEASLTLREWLDVAEAWRIALALRQAGGNRSRAARSLGIGRRTLYTKMKRLGIDAIWNP